MIEELGDLDFREKLFSLKENAIFLDKFYTATRYPNSLPSPLIPEDAYSQNDASPAIDKCTEIIEQIKKIFLFCQESTH